MAATGPHHIAHDHKYQSRGDFEKRPGYKNGTLHSPPGTTKRGSVFSDNDSTLVGSDGTSIFSKTPIKVVKYPDSVEPPEKPARRRRWWPWIVLIIIVLAIIVVLAALLIKRSFSVGGAVPGNSSAVDTTTIVISPQVTTITMTGSESTVTVTTTQDPLTTTVTQPSQISTATILPQPTVTPVAIRGFDIWRFYNGDIMFVYESQGSIWTKQYQGGWNKPAQIASDAKLGTRVRIWGWVTKENNYYYDDYYDQETVEGLTHWSVYYVDTDDILQEKKIDIDASGWTQDYDRALPNFSGSWYTGPLGSYEYKVSDAMYFETCAWGPLLKSESEAAGYLYFDAAVGGIQKIATDFDSWWTISDLPNPISGSSRAITCEGRGDQVENLWLINEAGELEQWWLNVTAAEFDTSMMVWSRGIKYNGTIHPNTTLTSWSTPMNDIIFFQAPNNMIMFITILGQTNQTSLTSSGSVAAAEPGSHMEASSAATSSPCIQCYGSPTYDNFYVYFQNGTDIMEEMMVPDSAGGPPAPSSETIVSTADARPRLSISGYLVISSFGIALCLLI